MSYLTEWPEAGIVRRRVLKGSGNLIILDLEWNRGYDKTPLDEILQIGAVRLERPGAPITDTFCTFIRPRIHKKLNRTAKALPEVRASLASDLDFPTAYGQFLAWCGEDLDFAAWGADDFDILRQNTDYWKLPSLAPRSVADLQTAFSLTLGTLQNIALWWAVEYCQLPECFTYHNALNDAMYSALVTPWLSRANLELATRPRWTLRYLLHPWPEQPDRETGPYSSLAAGLNAKASRRALCPVCGESFLVQAWRFRQEGTYYADLPCRRHGHFICRLTLNPEADGRWRGKVGIPPLTPALLQDFDLAQQGELHLCRGGHRSRRRRRRVRRKEQEKHE